MGLLAPPGARGGGDPPLSAPPLRVRPETAPSILVGPMPTFRLKYGQWELLVDEHPLIVGRGRDCDLRLEDPAISRKHATFQVEGNSLVVRDCSSRNGVFVDGAQIRGATRVPVGAVVRIGKHHIAVVTDLTDPATSASEGEPSVFTLLEDPRARHAEGIEAGPAAALSPRERQVVSMVARGFTQKQAAEAMDVSVKTIEGYLRRVREKVGVRSRADLVAYARVAGIVTEVGEDA